jgi:broad specificity phosphatase PhoE
MTARISFISHAATTAVRRAAFPSNESLEDREIARIKALGWSAPRAQHIFAGPEQRTQQTAHALGLPHAIEPGLRDCDYGTWQGRALSELQEDDPEGLAAWLTDLAAVPHGGESMAALMDRAGRWLGSREAEGHTVAVTHPGIIRSAIVHALGAPAQAFWRIDIVPLSLTDLRFNGRAWTLRCASCSLTRRAELE